MAHFYGTIQGQRGQASRLGTRKSGLTVKAASWQGAVTVELYERDGVDCARIEFCPHYGAGHYRSIYNGPVDGTAELK